MSSNNSAPDSGIERETIPLIPDYEKSKIKLIDLKYTIGTSNFKAQLPSFSEGTAEEFLNFLHEFEQAKQKLGYTTYAKIEGGLEQLLQGVARDEWNTVKSTIQPGINTLASFENRILAFKKIYVPDAAAINNQKSYLQRVRKTDKFTVPKFLDHLKRMNLLIAQFPNATQSDCFSDQELKQIFYLAMPIRWRTNFVNSGQTIHSSTIESLRTYMLNQEQQTDLHRLKKSKDKSKKQGTSSQQDGSTNPKRNQKGKRKGNSSQGRNTRKRVDNEAECPLHGGTHTWGQCY